MWAATAAELRAKGWEATVPAAPAAPPREPHDVTATFLHQIPAEQPVVLVPHSNAGLYVPALALRRDVVAAVFVDAGLPPARGAVAVTPPAFYPFLEERADANGYLPPWTQWWEDDDVSPLFPSDDVRRAVENDQRRLPLSYFRHWVDVPAGWDQIPSAYLAFGDTYTAEKAQAEGLGWQVRTLAGDHLHMLIDPRGVAREITRLLALLGVAGSQ